MRKICFVENVKHVIFKNSAILIQNHRESLFFYCNVRLQKQQLKAKIVTRKSEQTSLNSWKYIFQFHGNIFVNIGYSSYLIP